MPEQKTVGLVIAGAAARGAYEAGAISVLIPELDRQGKRPTVMVGSSAGGINAFLLAQYSDLEADEAVQKIVDVWARIELSNVLSPILPAALSTGALSLAEFLGIPGVRLKSLFDTAPLRTTVKQHFEADRLHRNIQEGRVRALALAATAPNGRTTVFVEATAGVRPPKPDKERAIDYVFSTIAPEHVLASAAIPVLFPPIFVKVKHPAKASGWYRDGLVRLNAPIKPALALGAEQLALVASEPDTYPSATPGPAKDEEPDIEDAGAQLLHAVLADHMVEDILTFHTINHLVDQLAGQLGKLRSDVHIKKKNGHSYQFVDSIFAGPHEPGLLGNAAEEYYEKHYGSGWKFLSTFTLLGRLLGNNSKSRGELLSWLFFEPKFLQKIIKMGQDDAEQRLKAARDSKGFPFN
jgi:NTE family protein